jgi:hypothetical protein
MKILSVTEGDGRVIEMSHQEFLEFLVLAKAVEGAEEWESRTDWNMKGLPRYGEFLEVEDGKQFDGVFGAIRAFYQAQFQANKLQHLVNVFYSFLKG